LAASTWRELLELTLRSGWEDVQIKTVASLAGSDEAPLDEVADAALAGVEHNKERHINLVKAFQPDVMLDLLPVLLAATIHANAT
jgi:hypothetical protein